MLYHVSIATTKYLILEMIRLGSTVTGVAMQSQTAFLVYVYVFKCNNLLDGNVFFFNR